MFHFIVKSFHYRVCSLSLWLLENNTYLLVRLSQVGNPCSTHFILALLKNWCPNQQHPVASLREHLPRSISMETSPMEHLPRSISPGASPREHFPGRISPGAFPREHLPGSISPKFTINYSKKNLL